MFNIITRSLSPFAPGSILDPADEVSALAAGGERDTGREIAN